MFLTAGPGYPDSRDASQEFMDVLMPDAVNRLGVQPTDIARMQQHGLRAPLARHDQLFQGFAASGLGRCRRRQRAEQQQQGRGAGSSNRRLHGPPG